jgi:hypothetical protein
MLITNAVPKGQCDNYWMYSRRRAQTEKLISPTGVTLEELERRAIVQALRDYDENRTRAAPTGHLRPNTSAQIARLPECGAHAFNRRRAFQAMQRAGMTG